MMRGRDKEAVGIEEIEQGLSWQVQRCSECANYRKQQESLGDSNRGKESEKKSDVETYIYIYIYGKGESERERDGDGERL